MLPYDYILFDADNTLFDFDAAEAKALDATLAHFGYPCDDVTRPLYRAVNHALWHRFNLGRISREKLLVERFAVFVQVMGGTDDPAALNRCYLDQLSRNADLIPGAEELCRALAPHCTLAIVTNGNARAQWGRFERSPLKDLIPWLFISEEVGAQKPEPRFFQAVLDAMGIQDARRAVVVGDDPYSDILGGNRAGLDTIWYHPAATPPPEGICPTAVVRTFAQLEERLLP